MSEYERNIALKESERYASEEAYFNARKEQDCDRNRKYFREGFDRAWDILTSGRKTDGKLIPATPFVQDSHPLQVPIPPITANIRTIGE